MLENGTLDVTDKLTINTQAQLQKENAGDTIDTTNLKATLFMQMLQHLILVQM